MRDGKQTMYSLDGGRTLEKDALVTHPFANCFFILIFSRNHSTRSKRKELAKLSHLFTLHFPTFILEIVCTLIRER